MGALDSPCVDVCTLDAATQSCLGCGRTLDEIEGWIAFSDAERVAAAARIASRWPASQCSLCGTAFACGATDCSTPCWCASYPPVTPVGDARCMCPARIAATVASGQALQVSTAAATLQDIKADR